MGCGTTKFFYILSVVIFLVSSMYVLTCAPYCYRYSNWLSTGMAARKSGNTGSTLGCEWAISALPDDLVCVGI